MRRVSRRAVLLAMLVVALLLAGIVSYYASSSPDGLNRVAQDQGFSSSQKDHAAGDGPFAGYATKGVGNNRLSGGLAGIVGSLAVLVGAGGLAFAVRRRGPGSRDSTGSADDTGSTGSRPSSANSAGGAERAVEQQDA